MFLLRFQCLVLFFKASKAFFFLVFRIEMSPNIGNRYTNAIAFICILEKSCLILLNIELYIMETSEALVLHLPVFLQKESAGVLTLLGMIFD